MVMVVTVGWSKSILLILQVYSFDLGDHPYARPAALWLSNQFPGMLGVEVCYSNYFPWFFHRFSHGFAMFHWAGTMSTSSGVWIWHGATPWQQFQTFIVGIHMWSDNLRQRHDLSIPSGDRKTSNGLPKRLERIIFIFIYCDFQGP